MLNGAGSETETKRCRKNCWGTSFGMILTIVHTTVVCDIPKSEEEKSS